MGLPAWSALAAAAKNASGRRIFSSARAMTACRLVLDEVLEIVGHVRDRLVAGGDHEVEPHTAHSIRARSQGLEQRTAVRDDRHAAGSPLESGEKRQLVTAIDVEVADAVWSDNGKVPTDGGPLQALLKSRPFASHLGEPARHDDETPRAGVRHLLGQRHGPGGRQQAEHGVHGSSDVGEAGVGVSTEHRFVLGVHDVGVHLAVEDRRDGL